MPALNDTPSTREQFLDTPGLASAGGVLVALAALAVCAILRLDVAANRAADDRLATALADARVSTALVVIRAPSRTGDWMLADAVQRLDSAGARAVGVAIDLSVPVAPTGTLPDLLASSPHAIVGVTLVRDVLAWPWFIPDTARAALAAQGRLGVTTFLRDGDDVIRNVAPDREQLPAFAEHLAATLVPDVRRVSPTGAIRLRFADPSTGWFGVTAVSLDSVLAIAPAALASVVAGRVVILGVDDGSTVPTSVGGMPPLAVLAHEVSARIGVRAGSVKAIRPVSASLGAAWLLALACIGAAVAALTSLRGTLLWLGAGIVIQAALALWLVDASGALLPLGTGIIAWGMAIAGAEVFSLWQVRRRQRLTALLFSRFVTPALAAEAWSERHLYLEGGRPAPMQLPVTVLFLDLRGFTRFSEANSAADVMTLLTQVTAACAGVVAEHGGLVDDFAGDGIKADFGVPVPRGTPAEVRSDAQNAVRCALALAATVERLLPPDLGTEGTQARIGVHSGAAVAGTIGGSARLKYTVVGDVVNVAARLQSVDLPDDGAQPSRCRIVVSEATVQLLDGALAPATDLGALTLSGRADPVRVYRLLPAPTSRS